MINQSELSGQPVCLRHFSGAVIKCLDRHNLQEKGFRLARHSKGEDMAGRVGEQPDNVRQSRSRKRGRAVISKPTLSDALSVARLTSASVPDRDTAGG